MLNHIATSQARNFWIQSGVVPNYQLTVDQLERAILSKPINTIRLCDLTVKSIENWFKARSFEIAALPERSRLHGFLYATNGVAFLFINGSDSSSEQLFTLAHELAHYIKDYETPRNEMIQSFGESIIEVLDGIRKPTIEERIKGFVHQLALEPVAHLLDHTMITAVQRLNVWQVEDDADQLAIEFLAPASQLMNKAVSAGKTSSVDACTDYLSQVMIQHYGLPLEISKAYARKFSDRIAAKKTLSEEWKIGKHIGKK